MSWLRGGIRSGLWKKHPVKLEFLKQNMEQMVNTNPRSKKRFPYVKAGRCAICKVLHKQTDIEVDHLTGNHSLRLLGDLQGFIEAMVLVTFSDLQLLCKPCHKIKSHAEKLGITFQHAAADKTAIELGKFKKDLAWLRERGIVPASSWPKRRIQIVEVLA